jgi:hypothetical protein
MNTWLLQGFYQVFSLYKFYFVMNFAECRLFLLKSLELADGYSIGKLEI